MRESCRIVAEVLALVGSNIRPGVVTRELDRMAEEYIRSRDGIPAFKGYGQDKTNLFPGTLCISIDDEVVHGIPDGRTLEEGQIVSIDVGVKKGGYFGDGARTFPVGTGRPRKAAVAEGHRRGVVHGNRERAGRESGCMTSPPPCNGMLRARAFRSCGIWLAMGSDAICMKSRRFRITAPQEPECCYKKVWPLRSNRW